jgi:hypothetical protein
MLKKIAFVEPHNVTGKKSCGHINTLFMHRTKMRHFFTNFAKANLCYNVKNVNDFAVRSRYVTKLSLASNN